MAPAQIVVYVTFWNGNQESVDCSIRKWIPWEIMDIKLLYKIEWNDVIKVLEGTMSSM